MESAGDDKCIRSQALQKERVTEKKKKRKGTLDPEPRRKKGLDGEMIIIGDEVQKKGSAG